MGGRCGAEDLDSGATQDKPVNRLGAHFESNPDPNQQRRGQFQNAIAKASYYTPPQNPPGEARERNPGLPLDSRGQQQYQRNSVQSGQPIPPSNSMTSRIKNVAYGSNRQQGNSFGINSNPPQSNSNGQSIRDGYLPLYDCSVQFINDIELPALESGQIKELFVKEGDAVKAEMVVGQMDDALFKSMLEQAELKLAIANQKANDDTSLAAAENEIGLAQEEYNRTRSLAAKGSKPQSELEQARFRWRLAMLKKIAAQNEKDNALGESKIEMSRMKEVQERIRRHRLTTNFDGYIIKIERDALEWVNAGETVMRVARMDRLWVQGIVNSNDVNPHELMNRPVTITLKLARGESTDFEGKIVNVGLERSSNVTYMVKAEVQNRPIGGHWVLQPECTVEMRIKLDELQPNTASFQSPPGVTDR